MQGEVDAIIEEATSTIGTLEEQQDTLIAAINSALEHETDSTLSQAGWPADAAACGDLKSAIETDKKIQMATLDGGNIKLIANKPGYYTAPDTITSHGTFMHDEIEVTDNLLYVSVTLISQLDSMFYCFILLDANREAVFSQKGSVPGTYGVLLEKYPTAKYVQFNRISAYYNGIDIRYRTYIYKSDKNKLSNAILINGTIIEPTYTVGGFITSDGSITSTSGPWKYSEPILVPADSILSIYGRGYSTTIAMITLCDSSGNNRRPVVMSDGGDYHRYSWRFHYQSYAIVCADSSLDEPVIAISGVKQGVDNNLLCDAETIYGYWCGNGDISQNGYGAYTKIEIPDGATYISVLNPERCESAALVSSDYYGTPIFLDNNNTKVAAYSPQNYRVAEPVDNKYYAAFPVPEDAKYFCVTSKLSSFDVTNTIIIVNGKKIIYTELSSYDYESADFRDSELRNKFENIIKYCDINDWHNKTWLMIGDSLTEKNARAASSYYDYIAAKTGINLINKGKSGNGYARGGWFYEAIGEVRTAGSDFDFCTFFGSGNDLNIEAIWGAGATWQQRFGDVTDYGTGTICGYINMTIERFFSVFPLKKLGIVTPTPWASYTTLTHWDDVSIPESATLYGSHMDDYANALVEICKRRGIPCLDLYHESGLRPWIEAFRVAYYKEGALQDEGAHPNSAGHKWIYPMFMQFIKQFLVD